MTSVKVAVRCRPFNDREKAANSKLIIRMDSGNTYITNPVSFLTNLNFNRQHPVSFSLNYPLTELHLDLRHPTEEDLWHETRRADLERRFRKYKQVEN